MVLNTGTDNCRHSGSSHALVIQDREGNQRAVLATNPGAPQPNRDFTLGYTVAAPGIMSNMLVQQNADGNGYAGLVVGVVWAASPGVVDTLFILCSVCLCVQWQLLLVPCASRTPKCLLARLSATNCLRGRQQRQHVWKSHELRN